MGLMERDRTGPLSTGEDFSLNLTRKTTGLWPYCFVALASPPASLWASFPT